MLGVHFHGARANPRRRRALRQRRGRKRPRRWPSTAPRGSTGSRWSFARPAACRRRRGVPAACRPGRRPGQRRTRGRGGAGVPGGDRGGDRRRRLRAPAPRRHAVPHQRPHRRGARDPAHRAGGGRLEPAEHPAPGALVVTPGPRPAPPPRPAVPRARPERDRRGRPDADRRLLVGRDRVERRRHDSRGRLPGPRAAPGPRAGEPSRIARALAMEAAHVATAGDRTAHGRPPCSRWPRPWSAAPSIRTRSACSSSPKASPLISKAAGAPASTAATGPRRSSATTARGSPGGTRHRALPSRSGSLTHLGEVAELSRRRPILLQEARERGDLYATMNLSTYSFSIVRLAADEPDRARDEVRRMMEPIREPAEHLLQEGACSKQ